eukprot:NODE_2225_length_2262_cov_11.033724.p1 GENE.NODE_2225_length_2262_cov_11.033724~~NODE_2225_length_2262_cov_11.033724.p1  ORF type:complete len:589 (+),score=137.49 NODE_2225_length_2262_cov_11.033724:276-2042(+)
MPLVEENASEEHSKELLDAIMLVAEGCGQISAGLEKGRAALKERLNLASEALSCLNICTVDGASAASAKKTFSVASKARPAPPFYGLYDLVLRSDRTYESPTRPGAEGNLLPRCASDSSEDAKAAKPVAEPQPIPHPTATSSTGLGGLADMYTWMFGSAVSEAPLSTARVREAPVPINKEMPPREELVQDICQHRAKLDKEVQAITRLIEERRLRVNEARCFFVSMITGVYTWESTCRAVLDLGHSLDPVQVEAAECLGVLFRMSTKARLSTRDFFQLEDRLNTWDMPYVVEDENVLRITMGGPAGLSEVSRLATQAKMGDESSLMTLSSLLCMPMDAVPHTLLTHVRHAVIAACRHVQSGQPAASSSGGGSDGAGGGGGGGAGCGGGGCGGRGNGRSGRHCVGFGATLGALGVSHLCAPVITMILQAIRGSMQMLRKAEEKLMTAQGFVDMDRQRLQSVNIIGELAYRGNHVAVECLHKLVLTDWGEDVAIQDAVVHELCRVVAARDEYMADLVTVIYSSTPAGLCDAVKKGLAARLNTLTRDQKAAFSASFSKSVLADPSISNLQCVQGGTDLESVLGLPLNIQRD